ncbi:MAG: hypothetical protein OSB26_16470, partial [Woeseiaceae bacterium]|nr:hypothetical protein [Woeseiaceae bacterium]
MTSFIPQWRTGTDSRKSCGHCHANTCRHICPVRGKEKLAVENNQNCRQFTQLFMPVKNRSGFLLQRRES